MTSHGKVWLPADRGLLLLLVGLLWLPGVGRAQTQEDCSTAVQDYQVALRSFQDGLYDSAVAGFTAYLKQCPEAELAAQAHYLLGVIFYRRQHFSDALRHLVQVSSPPGKAALGSQALLVAAQCARQLGQFERAKAYLQRVLTAEGTPEVVAAALYWLGELAFQRHHYKAARTYYLRVIKTQKVGTYAADAQYALGWLYRQQGDAAAALKAFSAFLRLAPEHKFALQARFAQAALFRETKQLAAAAQAFQRLAREAPENMQDEALFWWAETAYQLGHYAEASSAYQRLFSEYPRSSRVPAGLYGWGWAEVQQHHCAEAVRPWETLLKQAPQFPYAPEVHYQLGVCYLQLEQRPLAQRHLQQIVRMKTPSAQRQDALVKLATLALQTKAYPEAIRYYTLALAAARPEDRFRLHYLLGECLAGVGKFAQAIVHWRQVLAGPPTLSLRPLALFRIGSAYMTEQSWTQAIVTLRRLWDDFPGFAARPTVAAYLVQAYHHLQRCGEALQFYDALIAAAAEPQSRQAATKAKALCLFGAGRYAEVAQLLTPWLASAEHQAGDPQVLYLLGRAHMHLHHDQEALASFLLLRQRFPDDPLTVAAEPLLARTLEHAGRGGEALAVWKALLQRETLRKGTTWARVHLHVARLAIREGQLVDALDLLAPIRETAVPAFAAEALFLSGEVYLQQRQWDLALQLFQEVIDRYDAEKPWEALARLRLGVIYEHQQDWERALHAYQTLITTTKDESVLANVRQRIAAIEAGRIPLSPSLPVRPRKGKL